MSRPDRVTAGSPLIPEIETEVSSALDALGDTAERVAGVLLERGIKGDLCDGHSCPITEYLRMTVPGLYFSTGVERVFFSTELDYLGSVSDPVSLPMPKPASEFRRRFDHSEFPLLQRTRGV